MSGVPGPVTVGIDIGTTSVKAVAVDGAGQVVARSRVPHRIFTPQPDLMEHDAKKAWRDGPRKAYTAVLKVLDAPIAGIGVSAMVPSFTAVDRRGIPLLPGLLYGDARGHLEPEATAARPAGPGGGSVPATAEDAWSGEGMANETTNQLMPESEGFLHWAVASAPQAAGYWPAQAVATHALSGIAAIDTAVGASLGPLLHHGAWSEKALARAGADVAKLPTIVQMCASAGTLPGTDTVITGGTVDAFCDQLVAGATEPGDVLVIFGATLIVWAVADDWVTAPGLGTMPHTVPGRVLVGGPSNAGALFVDWARSLLRGAERPGTRRKVPDRPGDPERVPVWLPYLRGERSPYHNPMLRASVHGLDISQGTAAIERGVYEASGFVVRHMLELSGLAGRRIVASGGGSQSSAWMAAVADTTGLPVDRVAVPEGAAFGVAFVARMAAGLEPSLEDAVRWARTGGRVEPDPTWAKAADRRYRAFRELGPGYIPG
ncbi:MAG TPA: FGGY-family carbohydrate kinase [Acidimicrobiales bacterium]|nr:FGGY-family carbohydrate kinase [Acidimicrobiales bacterium]